jgi:hypothetical protein
LTRYRIKALEDSDDGGRYEWGWPAVLTAVIPLAVALSVTLIAHLQEVVEVASGG